MLYNSRIKGVRFLALQIRPQSRTSCRIPCLLKTGLPRFKNITHRLFVGGFSISVHVLCTAGLTVCSFTCVQTKQTGRCRRCFRNTQYLHIAKNTAGCGGVRIQCTIKKEGGRNLLLTCLTAF